MVQSSDTPARHRVVIVGGGFGGLYCAQALRRANVEVTLIDRRNFHLFQPLLYQVATGALSPANIASPLRAILKYHSNCKVLLGEVKEFDVTAKEVILSDGVRIGFDTLLLATGSTHHYFGKDAIWEPLAPGLKTIEDATEIRRNILSAFENAEREPDPVERKKWLTFIIVGGGPTGVEMAGSIAELARVTMRREFRAINPADCRVILVEGQPRVLGMFAEKLSNYAGKTLIGMGVELILNSHVTGLTDHSVDITADSTKAAQTIEARTIIWAAGVKASPLAKRLADRIGSTAVVDRGGRVAVGSDCSIPGQPNIFVVGDACTFTAADGKPLPGLAPVAMQMGRYVAGVIERRVKNVSPPAPFKYWDKGTMATIGRAKAVAETNGFKLRGFIAWMAWLFIHVLFLAQFENRLLVMFQWFWNFITLNRAARLITGKIGEHHDAEPTKMQ